MERWVQTGRRELLDRSLIWNQRHLLHALRDFEQFYNGHRPHQGICERARCTRCLRRSPIRTSWLASIYEDANASAASSTSTGMPREMHGRGLRQGQRRWSFPLLRTGRLPAAEFQ
nr:transposase [Micromonospora sp. 4G51]